MPAGPRVGGSGRGSRPGGRASSRGAPKPRGDLVIASRPLEATEFRVESIRWAYVFYESGLSVNVLYTLDDAGKRAVGFKLSDGMEVPADDPRD